MEGFDLGSIVAHIKAETSQFTAGLEEAKAQADGFAGQMTKIAVGAAAVVDAIVIGFGIKSVKAFSEAQAITAQLNQVLNSTGKVSTITAEEVHKLAMNLEEYSGQTHDAIEQGQTILLQYDGITKKTLPEASKAMVDLAQRMGVDTVSAAKALGLALTDPEAGIGRLRRQGVVLTEAQKEQIKTMQKSGDTAGAAALLMAALESKVGGAGEAYRKTLAGGVAEAKNKLHDFEELLGDKIVKTLNEAYDWYTKHARILNDVAGVLGTLMGVIAVALILYGNWIILTKGIALAQAALNLIMDMNPIVLAIMAVVVVAALLLEHWKTVKKWFDEFMKWFKQHWTLLVDIIFGPFGIAVTMIITHWKQITKFFEDMWADVKEGFDDFIKFIKPIAEVVLAIILLPLVPAALAWRRFHQDIMEGLKAVADFFKAIFKAIEDAIVFEFNVYKTIFLDAYHFVTRIWNDITGFFSNIMKSIVDAIKKPVSDFANMLYNAGKDLITGLIHGIESMAGAVTDKVKSIAKGIEDTAKKILKIFSPSQIFHDIGVNVGQGLVNGMNAMQDTVAQASGNMALSAVAPASAVVNNASSSSSITTSINGPINIGSNADASRFLAQLTRNQELAMKGLTPVK